MKVFLKRARNGIDAIAEFDLASKAITVLKGSILSDTITYTATFRGAKSIEQSRKGNLVGNVLQRDMSFKSASTAANFVTGRSTNGLIAWKDKSGKTIKEIIAEAEV